MPRRAVAHLSSAPDQPVVLDGGLATRLEARGHDLSGDLWSAQLLLDRPDEIEAAHVDFFEARAQVATSASYQLSREGLAALGREDDFEALLRRSVERARAAAEPYAGLVAASIGPYGAMLADGQEYTGAYQLDPATEVDWLRKWHRPRLEILADAGADLLAIETIPCLAEVEALLAEAERVGVPCWLALTADGPHTRRGEPIAEAFSAAGDVAQVLAVGVNCCPPDAVTDLVRSAARLSGKPAIAYPNSGETWLGDARAWSGASHASVERLARLSGEWVSAGARWIGGCCRVGPSEIAEIAELAASLGS
ncbi:MAG: homocysteine S-methyltransferase [Nocardioides sp.]